MADKECMLSAAREVRRLLDATASRMYCLDIELERPARDKPYSDPRYMAPTVLPIYNGLIQSNACARYADNRDADLAFLETEASKFLRTHLTQTAPPSA
ncbi:hypothetical protein EVAR_9886_1 [Eumeta japonica]|uniref:Uncharacterized protein n=1 Tax=Eumeta variegata TaxID=151549 RepID=A0A4C1TQC0_EUMVA|nr:hypothetical protein EVAR_9886_1 [Eumeta japonica]